MSAADTNTQGNQEDRDLRIVENTDGSVVVHDGDDDTVGGAAADGKPADTQGAAAEGTDARTRTNDDSDEDAAAEAAELAAAGSDDERERIREKRRIERQTRKVARKNREEDMRRTIDAQNRIIDEIRGQLDVINRRSSGADIAQVDERINQAKANVTYLEQVIADGTKSQNGEAVARATVELQRTIIAQEKLENFRQQLVGASRRPEAPQLDPRTVANARTWFRDNSWYDPKGGDADSRVVLALDAQLAQEGYNPASSDYWEELTTRVKAVLPKHFEGGSGRDDNSGGGQNNDRSPGSGYNPGASQRKPSRSVVTGGSSAAAGSSGGKGGYVLSPDRVQALKEAGVWDDPKARADAIRRYRDYDAQSAQSGR